MLDEVQNWWQQTTPEMRAYGQQGSVVLVALIGGYVLGSIVARMLRVRNFDAALRLPGSSPVSADASRSNVSLRLSPASTSRRVRSVATNVELPALEDPRTEILTIVASVLSSQLSHPASPSQARARRKNRRSERRRHTPPELCTGFFDNAERAARVVRVRWDEIGHIVGAEKPVSAGVRIEEHGKRPLRRPERAEECQSAGCGEPPIAP